MEGSIRSEDKFSVTGTVATSIDQQPPFCETTITLPRPRSEVSLYTPMRRKSLLTPGVATRTTTPAPPMPTKPRTRHSLPSTPARRGSPEPMDGNSFYLPFSIEDPASIPRALTPCDADYKQTGAFKLGTLRITNGSPASSHTQSPARDFPDKHGGVKANPKPAIQMYPTRRYTLPESLPSRDPRSPLFPTSPQLQVTSKHTAMEDELFEDEQHESPTIEVLDVRVDYNAKSLLPRPSLVSEGGSISTELSRADSGIVASPTSEVPYKPLAKADSGYSSNVSLRSLSSRRRIREKDSRSGELTRPNTPDYPIKTEESKPARAVLEVQDDAWPPPVQEVDQRRSLEATNGTFLSRRNLRLLRSFTKKSRTSLAEASASCQNKADVQSPTVASGSVLSIDITAGKQKKIQRLLNGARTPFSVQTMQTHPSEQTSVPPVPQDIRAKLHRRSGSLPKLMRTDMLKSARSKDTLGTIFSVGSAEASVDGITLAAQSHSENHEKAPTWEMDERCPNSTTTLGNSGTLSTQSTMSIAARRSLSRNPVPYPTESKGAREPARLDLSHKSSRSSFRVDFENQHVPGRSLSATEYENWARPVVTLNRTNTTVPSTSGFDSGYRVAKDGMNTWINGPQFLAPPEPPSPMKSPPPVSMKTRNKGYLQSRPRSTPPQSSDARDGPQLLHKESRERLYRSPPSAGISHSTRTPMTQDSSRDKLRSHSFIQLPSFACQDSSDGHSSRPEMGSRQSAVLRLQTGEYRVPNWDVQTDHDTSQSTASRPQSREYRIPNWNIQTDHGISQSRRSSPDRDRVPSNNARSAQGSLTSSRSNSIDDHPKQFDPESISHRSSCDGHTGLHPRSYSGEKDAYPSCTPPAHGHARPNGPWRKGSTSQQRGDTSLSIPHVPRHHIRNRSWSSYDAHGNPLPFRVLHSYNSPAYRNVPIWG